MEIWGLENWGFGDGEIRIEEVMHLSYHLWKTCGLFIMEGSFTCWYVRIRLTAAILRIMIYEPTYTYTNMCIH